MQEPFLNFDYRQNYVASCDYFTGDPKKKDFYSLLNITKDNLNVLGNKLLSGKDIPDELVEELDKLNWGVRSLLQFQDILSITFDVKKKDFHFFSPHYCYYESIVYIREIVISFLNINIISVSALIRPFLELSLLHIYWQIFNNKNPSDKYYKWLKGEIARPKFDTILNYIFDNINYEGDSINTKVKKIKKTFKNLYKRFNTYVHSPKIDDSLSVKSSGLGLAHFEDMLGIILSLNILLKQIIFLYILTYPMSIFPVDISKKFAFSGPVGIFFDQCNFKILKQYLGQKNITEFTKCLKNSEAVEGFMDFYNQQPDLSIEEINKSWKRFRDNNKHWENPVKPSKVSPETEKSLDGKIVMHKAFIRGFSWAMNYIMYSPKKIDKVTEEKAEKIYKSLNDF